MGTIKAVPKYDDSFTERKRLSNRIPTISIKKILTLRCKIYEAIYPRFAGEQFEGVVLNSILVIIARITKLIPTPPKANGDLLYGEDVVYLFARSKTRERYGCVQQSLVPQIGREITSLLADEISGRIAGGISSIRNFRVLTPWNFTRSIWAPVEVKRAVLGPINKGHSTVLMEFQILGEDAAGVLFEQVLPYWFVFKFGREMGYPKRESRKMNHPEIVGWWFMGNIGIKPSENLPSIIEHHTPPSYKNHNRQLRKSRRKCSEGLEDVCHRCVYGLDKCLNATHRYTYTPIICKCTEMSGMRAWQDTEDRMPGVCISCAQKSRVGEKI